MTQWTISSPKFLKLETKTERSLSSPTKRTRTPAQSAGIVVKESACFPRGHKLDSRRERISEWLMRGCP